MFVYEAGTVYCGRLVPEEGSMVCSAEGVIEGDGKGVRVGYGFAVPTTIGDMGVDGFSRSLPNAI